MLFNRLFPYALFKIVSALPTSSRRFFWDERQSR